MARGRRSGSAFESNEGKMTTIKYTLALDGCRSVISYTTTNQKHAKTANNGTDRRWDCGGARGRWNTIVLGEIGINSIIKILINCC
jgi:hypothetical protein